MIKLHRLPKISVIVAALALGTLVGIEPAQAAVPGTVMHQGRLFDAEGVPVDAILSVTFAIYADEDDPTPLWTETVDIAFDDGYFSAQLGSISPLDDTLFDGSTRWLGVQIGSDPEMQPRAPIGSVP